MSTNAKFADLHLHSNRSDGSDAPRRVVERAAEIGLAAIALTDHDTTAGIDEARTVACELGLELLPGTEISSEFGGRELHILGLGIRTDNGALAGALGELVRDRFERARKIVDRLNHLGVAVEWERVEQRALGGAVGRMHIAQEIFELGHSSSVQDSFDRYIKGGRPAFIPKKTMSCRRAIDLIHEAGGLAFIAHPGIGDMMARLNAVLARSFDGIEVYHSKHSPGQSEALLALARSRNLLVSGGSDCHGSIKGQEAEMGKVRLPYHHVARIHEALAARA